MVLASQIHIERKNALVKRHPCLLRPREAGYDYRRACLSDCKPQRALPHHPPPAKDTDDVYVCVVASFFVLLNVVAAFHVSALLSLTPPSSPFVLSCMLSGVHLPASCLLNPFMDISPAPYILHWLALRPSV